ncbi:tubulin monoglycylase TTLL3-like isoform X2 [Syngnathoides biaculeatus]|uniref:tubulin monoglycylase TTLL3-like isoform X2 n=1 Tax=Syngnathoides biaculeatus TaxID=300417 RepID=UPI002ADE4173|nr:tubulin monoglycylase TTLL3-like isoform X2 [Syngnathoides biaculeatus]
MVQQCESQVEIKTLQTTSPRFRHSIHLPARNPEKLKKAKAIVEKTVKLHKVFSVQGPYPVIRASLRARGWVEKQMCHAGLQIYTRTAKETCCNDAGDSDGEADDVKQEQDLDGLYGLISRLVRNEMVYFYWTNRRDAINTSILQKEQMINHFGKGGSFTTKVGLCVNLRSLHWFDSADPDTFFPRCYRLGAQDEKHAFIEDYRRTACTSFLKYIVESAQNVQEEKKNEHIQEPSESVIVSKMVGTALNVCQDFLESLEHTDIDTNLEKTSSLFKEEWGEFIDSYYLFVHGRAQIKTSSHLVTCCKAMLQRLAEVSPQLDTDGIHNIWIVKPGAKSRGRGIKCAKRLDHILSLVDNDPALIKESNSVHLCNNSIQKHLRPSHQRHQTIPKDNMWSNDQFMDFLSSQGYKAQWENVVVPGMKKAVIHSLQTAQDLVDSRKNTFELYGADFMLGCDLHPWLIEINASPTMAPSTPVTAHLCAAVQEDTLRVVLDRRTDQSANTGDFELIYHQAAVHVPQYIGVNLFIEGFRLKGTCLLPSLRPLNHSAPKHLCTKKEMTTKKVTSLPEVVKTAKTPVKNISNRVLPPPVPQPPAPIHIGKFTLGLQKTAHRSVRRPLDACSRSVFLWRKGL